MGAVFLYPSYDKILHPQAFVQAIYNYQILPDGLVNLSALVLPWLELLLGLCLVAGVWLPGATVITSGLLTLFLAALVFNQLRGLDIHCGCFSTEASAGPVDLWTVARDLGFLAAALYLTVYVFFIKPVATTKRGACMPRTTLQCWIALGVLLAPLWCAVGESSAGPEAVLKEDVFQFQPVLEGTTVVHEFVVHNRGDEDLKILNIQAG